MRRFRSFLDGAQLQELDLIGRRYTWSNGQVPPTLVRLDHAFASVDWFAAFPVHCLRALSSDCSDHCPLLLLLDSRPRVKKRFRFESFWASLPDFLEVVAAAWATLVLGVDAFRVVDVKLRAVAKALQAWSAGRIGSVRLQLALAREVVLRLDEAQESRVLSPREQALRKTLKLRVLGLASLARTIARQRSRLTFLSEGDANTRYSSTCKPVTGVGKIRLTRSVLWARKCSLRRAWHRRHTTISTQF